MTVNKFIDKIILEPKDIDLGFSPLRKNIEAETYVLGAFNPGLTRLQNGNLLIMVRIAEALQNPVFNNKIHSIRWDKNKGYTLDAYNLDEVETDDPRKFVLKKYKPTPIYALTSLSWLLPVELTPSGNEIVKYHYDKIIAPEQSYQEYGIEDARISIVESTYYMTTCSVSSERHSTTLYSSSNGLDYKLEGIILDHQNKDMLIFEGKIDDKFYALTRPLGSLYFASPPDSKYLAGPGINLSESPDLLHWKPQDQPLIRIEKGKYPTEKLGGGSPPILTPDGWFALFHGVEQQENVGIYRTFWAILDKNNPNKILHLDLKKPVLEANPELTEHLNDIKYLENVVFTTGIVDIGEVYIVASGELDLCCRITHIPKSYFHLK